MQRRSVNPKQGQTQGQGQGQGQKQGQSENKNKNQAQKPKPKTNENQKQNQNQNQNQKQTSNQNQNQKPKPKPSTDDKKKPTGSAAAKKPAATQGEKKDNKKNANQQIKKQQQKSRPKVTNEKSSRQRQTKTKGGAEQSKQALELIIKSKFLNRGQKQPTDVEQQICQHLVDLEASSKDLKLQLRDLGIASARRISITPTKHAIIVFVPFVQHEKWQKIQEKLSRELEKKFSGQDVVFVAQRRIMKLNQIKNNRPRPRNQTITSVHESILNDLVFPTKIVGKRLRFRIGGKRLLKVYLDPKNSKELEAKLPTFEAIYQKLTKKEVKFLFPRYVI